MHLYVESYHGLEILHYWIPKEPAVQRPDQWLSNPLLYIRWLLVHNERSVPGWQSLISLLNAQIQILKRMERCSIDGDYERQRPVRAFALWLDASRSIYINLDNKLPSSHLNHPRQSTTTQSHQQRSVDLERNCA